MYPFFSFPMLFLQPTLSLFSEVIRDMIWKDINCSLGLTWTSAWANIYRSSAAHRYGLVLFCFVVVKFWVHCYSCDTYASEFQGYLLLLGHTCDCRSASELLLTDTSKFVWYQTQQSTLKYRDISFSYIAFVFVYICVFTYLSPLLPIRHSFTAMSQVSFTLHNFNITLTSQRCSNRSYKQTQLLRALDTKINFCVQ